MTVPHIVKIGNVWIVVDANGQPLTQGYKKKADAEAEAWRRWKWS